MRGSLLYKAFPLKNFQNIPIKINVNIYSYQVLEFHYYRKYYGET